MFDEFFENYVNIYRYTEAGMSGGGRLRANALKRPVFSAFSGLSISRFENF